ncbi:oligosaccharide flippase family protein [Nostoc sp. HG1]|nr:oligosaccharide flippase family protein [Nostoc sp. HG1]
MTAQPSIRTAAIWGMAGQYVVFAAQFATSVIVSRYFLTPGEVGLFGTALAAAMMVAVFQDFGIGRYVSGESELDDAKLARVFSVSIIVALAIGLFVLALAWPVAAFYGDRRLFPVLATIAASYLLVPFAIVPAALLQRRLDFRALFVVNAGAAFAMAAVIIGTAAGGWSAMSLAFGTIAQAAVRALLGQVLSGAHPRWPLALDGLAPILRFGSGSSLLILNNALGTRTPELIIGRILDFVAVGLYGRAVGLSGQLRQLVSGSIGGVFFPAFSRMRDRGEPFAPAYLRVVSAYSVTTWPAMLFLAAAAAPLVDFLYGPVWAGVAPLLVLIAISELAFTALPLHMDVPIVLGRMRALIKYNAVETVISVALMIAAATISVEWAAASRIAYGILWFAVYARFMRVLCAFAWRDMLSIYARSLACAVATVVPLIAVTGRVLAPADLDFGLLALAAIGGCLCWAMCLFAVRHPARGEFIDLGRMLLARLGKRSVNA